MLLQPVVGSAYRIKPTPSASNWLAYRMKPVSVFLERSNMMNMEFEDLVMIPYTS